MLLTILSSKVLNQNPKKDFNNKHAVTTFYEDRENKIIMKNTSKKKENRKYLI